MAALTRVSKDRRDAELTCSELRHTARLITPAFALHVLEEAPGFTDWVNRYASGR
jgi:hypothetical protein